MSDEPLDFWVTDHLVTGEGREHEDVEGHKPGHGRVYWHCRDPLLGRSQLSRRALVAFANGVGPDFPRMGQRGAGDDLVLEVEVERAILDDEGHEVEQVLGVKLARVLGKRGWKVQRAEDGGGAGLDRLARLRALAVAAASAPRSTITAPGFIAAICAALISFG